MRNVDRPIIRSILDNDFYKYSMGQMVFNQFPRADVVYEFTNRGGFSFSKSFVEEVREQVERMADLQMTDGEFCFLKTIRFLKPTYVEWLRHYRFNPDEVSVVYDGNLRIRIRGPWYRTIFWEVPLMSIVSELHFDGVPRSPDWEERIERKVVKMCLAGVDWNDFGTRRRAAYDVQDAVARRMRSCYSNFRGTSNVHFAMKYGFKPQGTIAHEAHQAMQALYGARMSNRMTLEHWVREYEGDLGVMLPDTLTTKVFMRDLERREAKLFDGARQDSGDMAVAAQLYIDRLVELDVDPKSKILVPSDSLTDDTAIDFHRKFANKVKGVTAGIGTFLTNDVGYIPLNMVIKMVSANFGGGWVPVVKLSDVKGKYTGDREQIEHVKRELGIEVPK